MRALVPPCCACCCLEPTPSPALSYALPTRLKTISLVIRSTHGAEEVLKAHEEQLKEAQAVPATLPELEATKAALKVLLLGLRLAAGAGGSRSQWQGLRLKRHPRLWPPTEAAGPGGGTAAHV